MNILKSNLDGVFEIENNIFNDHRGCFVKTFHAGDFIENGLDADYKESFYSVSKKNVLRGMHYQLPPYDHSKLVYVVSGKILDVVVDIREGSGTFGGYYSTELSSLNGKSLYVGKGFAHGFLTLSESATVVYMTTTVYNPESDTGVRWDGFGYEWPVSNPIISSRDKGFKKLL